MNVTLSQITSLTIMYSTIYSGTDQRKHQSSTSLAFVRGIHWWPVYFPHRGPVMRKLFPFDDVNRVTSTRDKSPCLQFRHKWHVWSTKESWYTILFCNKPISSLYFIWLRFIVNVSGREIWSIWLIMSLVSIPEICIGFTEILPQITIHCSSRIYWLWFYQTKKGWLSSYRWGCKITIMIYVSTSHLYVNNLTHLGRATHLCVGKLAIIGSDNGLLPGWHHAIIWTSAGILLIGPLETNFNEILFRIQAFVYKKMHLKMLPAEFCPICLRLNVLKAEVILEVGSEHIAHYLENSLIV